MVPGHLSLTVRQMDVIIQAGQQPGVPFRLGAAGAQRPQVHAALTRCEMDRAENLNQCFHFFRGSKERCQDVWM